MKILDVLNSPWAIIPGKLSQIQEIYFAHLRGEKIEFPKQAKKEEKEQGYEIVEGVAIISIDGVIAKKMNLFLDISGGVSTQLIERDFREAVADPGIRAIVLNVDSPGGTVDGTQELANVIFEARGQKPIIAFTDGMMTSGAYWIGCAADKVYISGDTVMVGSIGVVMEHIDISRAEEKEGVKTTEIYAGKYKRIASRYMTLSEEGRATLQDIVDYIYSAFVRDVARNRGVSEEKTLGMADGKIFVGERAIHTGLVDGVSTLSDLVLSLQTRSNEPVGSKDRGFISAPVSPEILQLREAFARNIESRKKEVEQMDSNQHIDPNLPVEERAKLIWDRDADIREEFRNNFKSYFAFMKQSEMGNIRIIGRPNK